MRKKFWRQPAGGLPWYWFIGLGGIGVSAQILMFALASALPRTALQQVFIVNLCSYCGLLMLAAWSFFRGRIRSQAYGPGALPSSQSRHSRLVPSEESLLRAEPAHPNAPLPTLSNASADELSATANIRQLQRAVETMRLGVTITDMDGRIIYTNPAEAAMHGYAVEELLGKDLGILAPAELRNPMTIAEIDRLRHLRESTNRRKDGTRFPVRLLSDVLRDHAGVPIAIVTTCEDITEQKRLEQVMKQRTRELTLLNRMSERLHACHAESETYQVIGQICQKLFPPDSGCLCIMDATEPHLKVVEFWGAAPEQPLVPPKDADAPENRSNGLCPYQRVCSEQDCLCAPISVSGEILGLLSLCFRNEHALDPADPYQHYPKAKHATLSRVAEQYALSLINLRLRETLRLESIRDPLTGLFNRRYLEESLEREVRRAKRHNTSIGIIMLDIDHFKPLNDTYGHDAGDVVLQELGGLLQANTRGEDIACRYGGEEFLLILPEAPSEVVIQRAHELHAGIRHLKIVYHGQPLHITVSVGVAVLPDQSANVREVVKAADLAMYQAKRRGRDRVVVAQA